MSRKKSHSFIIAEAEKHALLSQQHGESTEKLGKIYRLKQDRAIAVS